MSKQRKRKLFFTALAFMLPFLILYTVFTIWPVIQGFYVSMHKWGLMPFLTTFFLPKNLTFLPVLY